MREHTLASYIITSGIEDQERQDDLLQGEDLSNALENGDLLIALQLLLTERMLKPEMDIHIS